MQQFDDKQGERRTLNIKTMTPKEAEDYYLQFLEMEVSKKDKEVDELKKRIKENKKKKEPYEWILAIMSKDRKVIGQIEVLDMGSSKAFFTINIPNENWILKYGTEAIKQFCKICREKQYFSTIELEKGNDIVEQYIKLYNKESYIEEIA